MTDLTSMLAPFKARVEAATEGPWNWFDAQIRHTRIDGWVDPEGRRKAMEQTERDIQFVMHARTDVPRLLGALESVLALHYEDLFRGHLSNGCKTCGHDYPCPTVAAVVAALGEGEKPFTGFPPTPLRKKKVG